MRQSRIIPKLVTVTACASVALVASSPGVTWAKQAPVLHSSPRWDAALARAHGGWGTAEEVPGTAALNTGGMAEILSVSCPSAGNCTAGGYYLGNGGTQGLVVSQVHGTWGKAQEVPGLAKLNAFGIAQVTSVSCASAGNCSAGGYYQTGNTGSESEAFVVSQVHGTWGKAEEVPGTAKLNTFGGVAGVASVSCGAAGDCSAAGYYTSSDQNPAFVVSQINGVWGKAEKLPVPGHPSPDIVSLSCASPGNCSAGGIYLSNSEAQEAFVVSQVHGSWGKAEEVPGIAALGKGNGGLVNSVSCASAGNCSAGGDYRDGSGHEQAFVVTQVHGTWGKAEEVPGTATLNHGGNADIASVSCTSAETCGAGGAYTVSSHVAQPFVVSQVHGTWGTAEEVPGISVLDKGNDGANITSVSCASAGNCSAAGQYLDSSSRQQVFVVNQVNGTWDAAEEVPGMAALNAFGQARITSVSCGAVGNCSAGGYYSDLSGNRQAFVVSRT
jgi:D-alanine-D-alanine ligase-like ATP-grasp enzyme